MIWRLDRRASQHGARLRDEHDCFKTGSGLLALKQALAAPSEGAYSENAYRSVFKLLLIDKLRP
jgi:hypothetical protein